MSRQVWRMLLVGAVDLVVATAVSTMVWMLFGVSAANDSMPPTCFNYFGQTVDCALERPVDVGRWVLLGVLLVGLLTFHALRGRKVQVR